MRRYAVLVLALFLGPGCAAEGEKGTWDDFWKDVRGENTQMHYENWRKAEGVDPPTPTKARP